MEPKKKNVSKTAGCKLGITLPSADDRDRFNEICEKEGKKQPETLLMLMDLYDQQPSANKKAGEITLNMYLYSGYQKLPRRAISFQGRAEFTSTWTDISPLSKKTAAKLELDFHCPVGDGVPFLYSRHMDLYYDTNKKSHLIHEEIWVGARDEWAMEVADGEICETPLAVSRCKYVSTFEEVYSNFSKYATDYELDGISRVLLDDIGEDFHLMDEYFGDIKFVD